MGLMLDKAKWPVKNEEFIHTSQWFSDGWPQTHLTVGETEAWRSILSEVTLISRELDLKFKCILYYAKITSCNSQKGASRKG